MKVKIIGAGSIGNHLSQASRRMGWDVTLCDVDPAALERTRKEIYPSRYGKWDDAIQLSLSADAPRGGFDIIFIGTPPDHHVSLAIQAIEEKPRLLFVEKPFCPPSLAGLGKLESLSASLGIPVVTGFDHSVGKSIELARELAASGRIGEILTHDVEFRESWVGIFKAHPWLAGPHDSYLGFWKRGGGASSEHSHALHMWLHLADFFKLGVPESISAAIKYETPNGCDYDSMFSLNITTDRGNVGRVIQDVVTIPTRKYARIQGASGVVEWWNNYSPEGDAVFCTDASGKREEHIIKKTRPDDFLMELQHIQGLLEDPARFASSPLRLELGARAARVVQAAHRSAGEKRTVAMSEVITPAD